MLVERGFAIGGALVMLMGALMLGGGLYLGLWPEFWPFPVGGVIMIGFGVVFVLVGRQARRDRLALLEIGQEGDPSRLPRP